MRHNSDARYACGTGQRWLPGRPPASRRPQRPHFQPPLASAPAHARRARRQHQQNNPWPRGGGPPRCDAGATPSGHSSGNAGGGSLHRAPQAAAPMGRQCGAAPGPNMGLPTCDATTTPAHHDGGTRRQRSKRRQHPEAPLRQGQRCAEHQLRQPAGPATSCGAWPRHPPWQRAPCGNVLRAARRRPSPDRKQSWSPAIGNPSRQRAAQGRIKADWAVRAEQQVGDDRRTPPHFAREVHESPQRNHCPHTCICTPSADCQRAARLRGHPTSGSPDRPQVAMPPTPRGAWATRLAPCHRRHRLALWQPWPVQSLRPEYRIAAAARPRPQHGQRPIAPPGAFRTGGPRPSLHNASPLVALRTAETAGGREHKRFNVKHPNGVNRPPRAPKATPTRHARAHGPGPRHGKACPRVAETSEHAPHNETIKRPIHGHPPLTCWKSN